MRWVFGINIAFQTVALYGGYHWSGLAIAFVLPILYYNQPKNDE